MPNWCFNNLTVSGNPKDVERFRRTAKGRTHTYNDFHQGNTFMGGGWPAFDEIRLMALISTPPELGKESDLSFHQLYSVPDEVRAIPYSRNTAVEVYKKLGIPEEDWVDSGYEWEQKHWGCKWGSSEAELTEREDGMLGYTFNTPWGPPMEFMEKVTKDYPELCFELEYEEPGMAFAGKSEWSDGKLTFEESWEIEEDSEWEE